MICTSIQERDDKKCIEILSKLPMAEIRADLCRFTHDELASAVSSHPNLIVTCRIAGTSLEYAQEQLITAMRHGARYVDVEIEAPVDFLEYIKAYAHANSTKLIISYHNFEGTQSLEELRTIADIARRKGADIVKMVTTAHNITEATRVLSLYKGWDSSSGVQLVAFAMGQAGKFTRHLCLNLGAPYTYSSLENSATAPGQYTTSEMMDLRKLGGHKLDFTLSRKETSIPCSKSVAQRAILAAAFAKGETTLSNLEPCNDISAALQVVKNLGVKEVYRSGTTLVLSSPGARQIARDLLSCSSTLSLNTGESGLLTRLLTPFAAYCTGYDLGSSITVTGEGSILGRDLSDACRAIRSAGGECSSEKEGYLPFTVSQGIRGGEIIISGRESSQTVSGLLMTLPLLQQDSVLRVTEPASTPYIDLTVETISRFGISIERSTDGNDLIFQIAGRQEYSPTDIFLEPDWSSASIFAVAYAIASSLRGGKYLLQNMRIGTKQADEAVLEVLKTAGADIEIAPSGELSNIYISAPRGLIGFEFDATNGPDLFPILAILAMFSKGRSAIRGVGRLLQKESNRAESIFTEFSSIGGRIEIMDDTMYIDGGLAKMKHKGYFNLRSHNDHRIAMSLIVASLFIQTPVYIDQLHCIDKSFPTFIERL